MSHLIEQALLEELSDSYVERICKLDQSREPEILFSALNSARK